MGGGLGGVIAESPPGVQRVARAVGPDRNTRNRCVSQAVYTD